MRSKYELTDETREVAGRCGYRIRALRDIPEIKVKAGDLGGFVESVKNLAQDGTCWIFGNAAAVDGAEVKDDALLHDNALACSSAHVKEAAQAVGNAVIRDDAYLMGESCIYDNVVLCDNAVVTGNTRIYGNMELRGDTCMDGEDAVLSGVGYVSPFSEAWV